MTPDELFEAALQLKGTPYGHRLHRTRGLVLAVGGRHGEGMRHAGRAQAMNLIYELGAMIALALLIYLVAALLNPESFS